MPPYTPRREGVVIETLTSVTLDRVGITVVLNKLATKPGRARELYNKIMGSWGQRPDRQRVTLKLGERDLQVLEALNLRDGILGRDVLPSGYLAVYQHPRNPQLEVTIHTKDKPPKRRTLKVGGKRRQLTRVSVRRIGSTNSNHTKEATLATKTRRKAKQEEEDLDELEGLEDLEDLEDEDLEDEEPEDEEEDEDEEPAPKRRGKAKPAAKKAPAKKTTRKRAPEPEEEDDEEDEEEDEAPARKRTAKSKTAAKSKIAAKEATKGKSSSSKKGNGNLPAAKELPKGQVGPADIAEMVGGDCDARYVRIYLRENYDRPEGGRWAFGKQDARSIAKEIRTQRKRNS